MEIYFLNSQSLFRASGESGLNMVLKKSLLQSRSRSPVKGWRSKLKANMVSLCHVTILC
jgi:hypothetical protein